MLESSSRIDQDVRAGAFLRELFAPHVDADRGSACGRPAPRAQRKSLKPCAVCSRCERYSFLAEDAGQACPSLLRGRRCGGFMLATDASRDWSSCQWCAGFGWHRGMCCIKCDGTGWTHVSPVAKSPFHLSHA